MNSVETFPLKPSVNYYEGPENSLEEIEMHLLQFTGGTIDLNKSDSGIATLCINHYEKRNAISGKMMVELGRVVAELEAWRDGKGVIVYGSGGTFCSGGDLDMARLTGCAADGFKMSAYMTHVLDRLERLPLLTVALIEGSGALGGGAEVALACDFRLLASGCAGVAAVHARMGLTPAWGGAGRLVALLGRRRALDLLATARVVPPQEALALGLADGLLGPQPHQSALAAAEAWLRERTRAPPEVIRALKVMCDARAHALDERRIFAPLWGASANRHALASRPRHTSAPADRDQEPTTR